MEAQQQNVGLGQNVNRFAFDPSRTTVEYGQFPFDGLSAQEFLRICSGDFEDDFDLDAAAHDLVDAVNEVLNPHGVSTTVSGLAFSNLTGSDLDPDELKQAVWGEVDVYEILGAHDISNCDGLESVEKDCREAAGVLADDDGHDMPELER